MATIDAPHTQEPTPITDVATAARVCQDAIGQRLTAWIVGVRDPKAVGRWITGTNVQQDEVVRRLLALAYVIQVLANRHDGDSNWTRTWLLSPNPKLEDASAAEWIRDQESATPVIRAARSYVE
ncbi:MAG: hypothetical protein KDC46_02755 [Thermoleophilia bacterium]|nr:hypothetical protein [Thermoleophilia bacterium]